MPDQASPSPATEATRRSIAEAATSLPMHDTQDFDDVARGFIASAENRQITTADGSPVWVRVDGDVGLLQQLIGLLDPGDQSFSIVTP